MRIVIFVLIKISIRYAMHGAVDSEHKCGLVDCKCNQS